MRYFNTSGMRLVPFADDADLEECLDEMFRVNSYRNLADEDTGRDCLFYLDALGQVQFSFFPADHSHRALFRDKTLSMYFSKYDTETLFRARLPCLARTASLPREAYFELFSFLRGFSTRDIAFLCCIQHCEEVDGADCLTIFGREKDETEAFL